MSAARKLGQGGKMPRVRAWRLKDNKAFADPCFVADSFFSRFRGLMGLDRLEEGTGLLIEPCNSIHTFFMKFAIDAVYLDGQRQQKCRKVLAIRRGMNPWRMDFPVFGAGAVLELPAGSATGLEKGDVLCIG